MHADDERSEHGAAAEDLPSMLSALVDGEGDPDGIARLTEVWRDDASARGRWHAYHLIGDVLRSDELGGSGTDAAFLRGVRDRLAAEPVVLAPVAVERDARRQPFGWRRLRAPAAMAAGFAAVVGSLMVLQLPSSPTAPQLAAASAESPAAASSTTAAQAVATAATPGKTDRDADRATLADAVSIRDARLDQYLAAHKQFGASSALDMPSGFLRNATYEGPSAAAAAGR